MKALHFLRWPLVLLLAGYLAFLLGDLSKMNHGPLAAEFISSGYLAIIVAIAWIIIKFIFLNPPEDDTR